MNQYFAELARVLARKDIKTASPENGRLPILLGNYSIGRVEPSGTMCLTPEDLQTPETSELYFRVAPIANMVKEYMSAMEHAPPLHADGLNEEYKLLTEFNGTVLAGREMDGGYGMKFV
ncbi:MAG: hypothetical protein RR369_05935, partial [Lachnospiraceae bacterium]